MTGCSDFTICITSSSYAFCFFLVETVYLVRIVLYFTLVRFFWCGSIFIRIDNSCYVGLPENYEANLHYWSAFIYWQSIDHTIRFGLSKIWRWYQQLQHGWWTMSHLDLLRYRESIARAIESKTRFLIGFTICTTIYFYFIKLALTTEPNRCKGNANHESITHVSPR